MKYLLFFLMLSVSAAAQRSIVVSVDNQAGKWSIVTTYIDTLQNDTQRTTIDRQSFDSPTELKSFVQSLYGQRIERDSLDMVEKTSRMEENRQEQARILQDIDRMGGVGSDVRKKKS